MSKKTQTQLTESDIAKDIASGIITYELKQPVTIDNTEYKKITLDFLGLTGEDLISIEVEMTMTNVHVINAAELSKTYLMIVASRAAKIPYETLKRFSIRDLSKITLVTQTFLMQE